MSQFDFVILGGGIAGLTAAHELTKQGASRPPYRKKPPSWRSRPHD